MCPSDLCEVKSSELRSMKLSRLLRSKLVTLSGKVLLLEASESMESVGRRIDLKLSAINALSPPTESRHSSDELSRCSKFNRRKEFEFLFWIPPKSQAELK